MNQDVMNQDVISSGVAPRPCAFVLVMLRGQSSWLSARTISRGGATVILLNGEVLKWDQVSMWKYGVLAL